MIVRNANKQQRVAQRGGGDTGRIAYEVNWLLEKDDFASNLDHVAAVKLPPGASGLRHSHAQEEIYLLMAGSATMYVDADEQVLSPGDMVLIHPGKTHYLANTSDAEVTFLAFNSFPCGTNPPGE